MRAVALLGLLLAACAPARAQAASATGPVCIRWAVHDPAEETVVVAWQDPPCTGSAGKAAAFAVPRGRAFLIQVTPDGSRPKVRLQNVPELRVGPPPRS